MDNLRSDKYKLARHNKKKDKLSNSDFTLVELIVVVILAIIIGVTIAGIYNMLINQESTQISTMHQQCKKLLVHYKQIKK